MIGADGDSLLTTIQICSGLEKMVKIQQSGSNLTAFKLLQLLLQVVCIKGMTTGGEYQGKKTRLHSFQIWMHLPFLHVAEVLQ